MCDVTRSLHTLDAIRAKPTTSTKVRSQSAIIADARSSLLNLVNVNDFLGAVNSRFLYNVILRLSYNNMGVVGIFYRAGQHSRVVLMCDNLIGTTFIVCNVVNSGFFILND